MTFDTRAFVDSECFGIQASDIDEDGSAFQYIFVFTNTTTNDVYMPSSTNTNQSIDWSTVNIHVGDEVSCSASVEDSNGGIVSNV